MGPRDVEQVVFARRHDGIASSSSSCLRKNAGRSRNPREHVVIVIEDEESEQKPVVDEQEVIIIEDDEGGSFGGDTSGTTSSDSDFTPQDGGGGGTSSSSTEVVDEVKDEDELQVLGCRFASAPRFYDRVRRRSAELPGSSSSSGCEEITSQEWKEAALRRRGSRSEPVHVAATKRVKVEAQSSPGGAAAGAAAACVVNNEDEFGGRVFDDNLTNAEFPECSTNTEVDELSKVRSSSRSFSATKAESPAKATVPKLAEDASVMNREVLRQAPEFMHADQQEWASRQLELQKQALEIQKLKRRRKAEAERKLQMESRQKQRLQEMRESQMKEEQTLGMKEQLRGHVQAELERVALRCVDLASLLQKLGINLGATPPSVQQVNAGYKQALFRFHPDRASTRGDIRSQVEAEEKFKLISRMKNVLRPVASLSYNR